MNDQVETIFRDAKYKRSEKKIEIIKKAQEKLEEIEKICDFMNNELQKIRNLDDSTVIFDTRWIIERRTSSELGKAKGKHCPFLRKKTGYYKCVFDEDKFEEYRARMLRYYCSKCEDYNRTDGEAILKLILEK